jgi:hypothetical protein
MDTEVIEVLYKDTIVVESGDNRVMVIEPKVIVNQISGGGGGGTWGTITGDIDSQTDLIDKINTKENKNLTITSDNIDDIRTNGRYSLNFGELMLVVMSAYGNVLQITYDKSNDVSQYRWSIDAENWGEWVTLADKRMIDNLLLSTGTINANPNIVDIGGGQIAVESSTVSCYTNDNFRGLPQPYIAESKVFTLIDNATNYIVFDGTTGEYELLTDVTSINESNIIPISTIIRTGNTLHTVTWDTLANGLSNRLHQSIVKTQRYRRESGLAISESNGRIVNLTSGIVWMGANKINLNSITSSDDGIIHYYHSSGNWVSQVVSQYNNTQYDDGTNLVTLTANRYAVNWLFRGVENQNHLYLVMGSGDYTQQNALNSTVPSIPAVVANHAVLVGRILVVKGSGTAYLIQSAFDTVFAQSPVSVHNDLAGLNDGNYQHLTVNEKLLLTQAKAMVLPQDFVGGTASPYQGLIVGGLPVIVKKFINQNSYFTMNPFQLSEYFNCAIEIMLTESVMPIAGEYIDIQINGNTAKRYTFTGTETQFSKIVVSTIEVSDMNLLLNNNTLSVSGTYAQRVGVTQLVFFYSRGV